MPRADHRGVPAPDGGAGTLRRAATVGASALVVAVLAAGCATAPVASGPSAAAPPSTSTPPSTSGTVGATTAAEPRGVRIPAIDVASDDLLRLGIAPDGSAEVPTDYDRIGWFAGAPDTGPTVLLGHVDSTSGPAAFYRLRDLRPGDEIEVDTADGTARYVVERTEQVAKDEFPTFAVFGASAQDVLRLVTCAGEFDRGARSYTDNLVVHARRA